MTPDNFKGLVEKAKSDATFFHNLVFDPEKILSGLELGRREKGALVALSPSEAIARLVGITSYCGNTCTSSCDNTCGGSCGYTTNFQARPGEEMIVSYYSRSADALMGCGNTCTSSCDNTCGGSCGYTTNRQVNWGWQENVR